MVPMMRLPFIINFILPVPEASVPAVEICWDSSVPTHAKHKQFVNPDQNHSWQITGSLQLCLPCTVTQQPLTLFQTHKQIRSWKQEWWYVSETALPTRLD